MAPHPRTRADALAKPRNALVGVDASDDESAAIVLTNAELVLLNNAVTAHVDGELDRGPRRA